METYERALPASRPHRRRSAPHATPLGDRRRYIKSPHTLRALLGLGAVPIVNENDTVAVEELTFGDN